MRFKEREREVGLHMNMKGEEASVIVYNLKTWTTS